MMTAKADVNPSQPPLHGLRVIELANDPAGEFTGRLLASLGAEVLKIEPTSGAPSRKVGPFYQGTVGPETSLNFWHYNANKKSLVVDVEAGQGAKRLDDLLATADIFICTLQPKELKRLGLDLGALAKSRPKLIVLSVTAFGLDGPWADYRSSDLVALALGGPLNLSGYDDHSIPPIRPGGNQGYQTVASFALVGALLALLDRQKTGAGQLADVSMHEALAVNVELANPYWFYPRVNVQRQTCRHAQPIPTQPGLFQCVDGKYIYYTLILADQRAWKILVSWMDEKGMAADLTDPVFNTLAGRQERFGDIQGVIESFFLVQSAEDAYRDGQERGLPIGILKAPEDLFEDAHLKAREFFVDVKQADGTTVRYPGPLYRFSDFESVPTQRAPRLGEHDNEEAEGDHR
jgi:crotonobetainyl-CoA:carnitine CoA-transferase CaiB-like acyl-CoA transferase